MAGLLKTLLVDLKRRGDWILHELRPGSLQLSQGFEQHRSQAVQRIQRAVGLIEAMLADPDLGDPTLAPNFFMDFKRVSELVISIEDTSLLVLKRCADEDQFLTALVAQICREIGYLDPPPLCGALSFQYFQALLETDVIMTPQGQAGELLALPDLYHEVAHFVVFRQRAVFEVPVQNLILRFFTDLLRRGRQQGAPKATLDAIPTTVTLWTSHWHIEFVCDMIAAFWCGPAYALANLRLSATRGDPYQDSNTHPADDARKIGIECILKLNGEGAAAQAVDQLWSELKQLSPSVEPQGYAKRYPTTLLADLAQIVHQACLAQKYRPSHQGTDSTLFVAKAIGAAWDVFRQDATKYPAHELTALADLRIRLAIP